MRKLTDRLSAAVAKMKFAKAAEMAMRIFLNHRDPRLNGFTAAIAAAEMNRPEAVRLLHELRADLDKPATDEAGGTPTGIAVRDGHTAMVQLLYDLGADVHRTANDGVRPMHVAALHGHDKTVLLLLSLRAAVNTKTNRGYTACWSAATQGHIQVVTTLLRMRADPNLAVQGFTAADAARGLGHDGVAGASN